MDYKSLYEAVLADTKRLAFSRIVASHLAIVALYDLKGIDALYPDVRDKCKKLIAKMASLGKPVVFTEGIRTAARQHALYCQGRTTPGPIVTNADGLQSYHNYGLGFDLTFVDYGYNPAPGWWDVLGTEGKKLGLEWGGNWAGLQDRPHFEWHPDGTWKELEAYFKATTPTP